MKGRKPAPTTKAGRDLRNYARREYRPPEAERIDQAVRAIEDESYYRGQRDARATDNDTIYNLVVAIEAIKHAVQHADDIIPRATFEPILPTEATE